MLTWLKERGYQKTSLAVQKASYAVKTIGNMINKMKLTLISYIDTEGFPISKAMLAPREREGIKTF